MSVPLSPDGSARLRDVRSVAHEGRSRQSTIIDWKRLALSTCGPSRCPQARINTASTQELSQETSRKVLAPPPDAYVGYLHAIYAQRTDRTTQNSNTMSPKFIQSPFQRPVYARFGSTDPTSSDTGDESCFCAIWKRDGHRFRRQSMAISMPSYSHVFFKDRLLTDGLKTMRSAQLFGCSVASALLIILGGCNDSSPVVANDRERVSVAPGLPIIDAGVLLVDRPFYLCIPLARVGLRSDEEIISLHSSCDCVCVCVQLVEFLESGRQATSSALLIESVQDADADVPSSGTDFSPSNLRIEVGVEWSDGRTHRFFVEFVESELAADRRARKPRRAVAAFG